MSFSMICDQAARELVDVRITATTVEVLFKNRRVASHRRVDIPGKPTTLAEHMPKPPQQYLEWTPSRIINWGGKIGPNMQKLVTRILDSRPPPEQGFRSCLGIMSLAKKHSPERLEDACYPGPGAGITSTNGPLVIGSTVLASSRIPHARAKMGLENSNVTS